MVLVLERVRQTWGVRASRVLRPQVQVLQLVRVQQREQVQQQLAQQALLRLHS
jgi:hypothetical protein